MKYGECPNCERLVNVGKNPRIGQHVICSNCGTKLEIYWLDPIELDWAPHKMKQVKRDRTLSNEEDEFGYDYLEER
jgi:lysine biosynthesis protein LysW